MEIPQQIKKIQESLAPVRESLVQHELYSHIKKIEDLRIFMEHHVFAVWDFMCLVKTLQYHLTSIRNPWLPKGNSNTRRLLNDIVMCEESDSDGKGGYLSHYELYREAMKRSGADTSKADEFIARLWRAEIPEKAVEDCDAPRASQEFVKFTMEVVSKNELHKVASAFTFGREELIPDMFRSIVSDVQKSSLSDLDLFIYYLDRHIEVDEGEHGPMAFKMIGDICKEDAKLWKEVEDVAYHSLRHRIQLWDRVLEKIKLLGSL